MRRRPRCSASSSRLEAIAELLEKLGLGETPEPEAALTQEEILSEVASGALTPDEAQELISRL